MKVIKKFRVKRDFTTKDTKDTTVKKISLVFLRGLRV